jgi:AraC family transcriptional regulator
MYGTSSVELIPRGSTADDFLEWLVPGRHADLIDGTIVMRSPVSLRHRQLVNFVDHLIRSYVEEHELGRVFGEVVAVRLSARNVYTPDLAFYRRDRLQSASQSPLVDATILPMPNMNATQREYRRRINRVMDYVDRHLGDPLCLEQLAEVATFSKYHFHRIFYAHVGETPMQYLTRLRLGKAAVLLAGNPDRSVTEVALDVGYSDMAAFARAFRKAFDSSPTEYRRRRSNLGTMDSNVGTAFGNLGTDSAHGDSYDSCIHHSERRNSMQNLETSPIAAERVEVVERPETTIAYVRHTGPYFGDEELFQRLFKTLYNWAGPRNLVERGVTEEIIIYHDDPETVAPEKLRVSCGISVPADTEVSGEVGKLTLDAGTYAEARFTVDATQFGGAWIWLYGTWLPESGYQPDDRLCFERYPDTDPHAEIDGTTGQTFTVDICIPVKPL